MSFVIYKSVSRFIWPLLIIVSCFYFLKGYFFPQFQITLGILIAPFVFRIQQRQVFSNRYVFVSLVFLVLYYFLCMKLFLFLSLGAFLFYSIESRFGKVGLLPFIFLICISPALHYVVTLFTFNLRLGLSHYAAELMNLAGYAVTCHGNYFTLQDGFTFNVDKACLGLNMFNTGLALTVLLVGLAQKHFGRNLPFFYLCLVFMATAVLLVLANFLRILVIVVFRSMPESTSHELIGMFSMIVYVALPAYFIIQKLVKQYGRERQSSETLPGGYRTSKLILPLILFGAIFFSFKRVETKALQGTRDEKLERLSLEGFQKSKGQDSVMEFRKGNLLVYIKPAVKAFESDHPPALCWKGSGFDVEQTEEICVANTVILFAMLKKDSVTQYTAWWYDNGTVKTINQWVWRLSKDEPFRIINLTSNSKEELLKNCEAFVKMKLF